MMVVRRMDNPLDKSAITEKVRKLRTPQIKSLIRNAGPMKGGYNGLDEVCYYRAHAEIFGKDEFGKNKIKAVIDTHLNQLLGIDVNSQNDINGKRIRELTKAYVEYSSLEGEERMLKIDEVARKTFILTKFGTLRGNG
jgi:hypothetical protein